MTEAREVRALLDDRPDLEPALTAVLETDERHETWTFDDLDIDSGSFGELVSKGVVEKTDGEYRLADREAVERGLAGDVPDGDDRTSVEFSLPEIDIDGRVAAALVGALGLVFLFRILAIESVYRSGTVVLSGNDPYYYLYWTEEAARQAAGPFDIGFLASDAYGLANGEPLLVAVLWFATELLGGVSQAPTVLAWYPVVAGVTTGLFVYLLATGLTDDRRVGIASVVMLAVMPVLAYRSGLGYADHHAFDYVWLTLTAAAAVRLARTDATREAVADRRTLAWAVLMGVAITGQLLGWDAGPLLLFPLLVYVPFAALVSVAAEDSVTLTLAPLALGFAVAGALTVGLGLPLGWQSQVVLFTPILLLVGTAAVVAAAEVIERLPEVPVSRVRALGAVEAVGALVTYLLLTTVLSSYGSRLFNQLERIGTNDAIVEASSLFSSGTFGWLFLFGLLLFIGIPYMGWALIRSARSRGSDGADRRGWLLTGSYGVLFLVLSVFQMRFAGELSSFLAVFSGFGFVHIAERVELARPPVPLRESTSVRRDGGGAEPTFDIPTPRSALALVFLFLLISGLSVAQAPVKANQVTIPDRDYQTAAWIDGYAEERNIEYPENYVFSQWGDNRMYNYHVNGQSSSYGFAQNNYLAFARSADPDAWYPRLEEQNVGFIVFLRRDSTEGTTYNRLTSAFGSRFRGFNGTGHYRAVYVSESHQVHRPVPGAHVTGSVVNGTVGASNATVFLQTETNITGYENPYVRRTFTNDSGGYDVRVAYPGTYEVLLPDANATRTFEVPESAVMNGDRVDAGTTRINATGNTTTTARNTSRLRPLPYRPPA
jgi:dolichyl-diphosphooligosaccharide--protein glycosyltransferase